MNRKLKKGISPANGLKSLKSINKKALVYLNFNLIDAIAAAAIHATIFSIIIGFISAYALYVYSKVNEMEAQLLQEASKVNTIQLDGSYVASPGAANFDSSNVLVRKDNLEQLIALGMGLPTYYPPTLNPLTLKNGQSLSKPLAQTQPERGNQTLTLLFSLYTHYPFATQLSTLDSMLPNTSKPIEFKTTEDVKKWSSDIEEALRPVLWTLTSFSQTHQQNFDAYAATTNNNPNGKSVTRYSVEDYLRVALAAKDLARSVKSQIIQIEARKPNKNALVTGLIIALAGFFFGVIVPMFYRDTNPVVFLVIPCVCYFFIFSYLIYFIAEK